MGGSLDLGEIDAEAFTGDVFYTRIRRRWYYDVVMTDVDVEGKSVGVEESCQEFNVDKTIVDSGLYFEMFVIVRLCLSVCVARLSMLFCMYVCFLCVCVCVCLCVSVSVSV